MRVLPLWCVACVCGAAELAILYVSLAPNEGFDEPECLAPQCSSVATVKQCQLVGRQSCEYALESTVSGTLTDTAALCAESLVAKFNGIMPLITDPMTDGVVIKKRGVVEVTLQETASETECEVTAWLIPDKQAANCSVSGTPPDGVNLGTHKPVRRKLSVPLATDGTGSLSLYLQPSNSLGSCGTSIKSVQFLDTEAALGSVMDVSSILFGHAPWPKPSTATFRSFGPGPETPAFCAEIAECRDAPRIVAGGEEAVLRCLQAATHECSFIYGFETAGESSAVCPGKLGVSLRYVNPPLGAWYAKYGLYTIQLATPTTAAKCHFRWHIVENRCDVPPGDDTGFAEVEVPANTQSFTIAASLHLDRGLYFEVVEGTAETCGLAIVMVGYQLEGDAIVVGNLAPRQSSSSSSPAPGTGDGGDPSGAVSALSAALLVHAVALLLLSF
eukprot:Gregarina_sp_Pseudo_9__3212@NODE_339_length_3111_cov_55_574219_g319_i0_p1_GENE_NODE_339_length_3111_cov_55_574219_g319_i0NODE_339_length_3111_cov_55_574219_g319_i0_p1_ORF_typecomplete_len444_score92_34_NODE_339_length_3111_cov_55_574219_g319_i01371468